MNEHLIKSPLRYRLPAIAQLSSRNFLLNVKTKMLEDAHDDCKECQGATIHINRIHPDASSYEREMVQIDARCSLKGCKKAMWSVSGPMYLSSAERRELERAELEDLQHGVKEFSEDLKLSKVQVDVPAVAGAGSW